MNRNSICILLAFALLPVYSFSQVKIGDPTGVPDPKAILELKDTTRGFLLPRMTQSQMNAISTPPDGLLVYNNSAKGIFQFRADNNIWMPVRSDSSDWYLDTSTAKLYLKYGLANKDSIYYHTTKKKFLFTDTRFYGLTNGAVFNLDEGNSDKFIFKTTASRFPRQVENLNSANIYSVFEGDNDTIAVSHPFTTSYTGIGTDAIITPSATQKMDALYGTRTFTVSAGQDSINVVYGLFNHTSVRGNGYADVLFGLSNTISVRDNATANIGLVYGVNNQMSYSSLSGTPRVLTDLYGYYLNISSTFTNKVDGNAYGVLLRNVTAAGANKNWGIYTSRGVNRFGDSVLITDGNFSRPRAVLDVNTTSAMILPIGTTAQRPVNLYTGMLRYNTDNATPEAYTGSAWVNLKSPVLAATGLLDPPLIANNTTVNVNFTLAGAAIGNTVTISPAIPLPSGILIAWSNVSAVNQVTIGFANMSGAPVDLPAQNFYIKVIQ